MFRFFFVPIFPPHFPILPFIHINSFCVSRLRHWARSVRPTFRVLRARLHHRVLPDAPSHQLRGAAHAKVRERIPWRHPARHGPERHAGRLLFCQTGGCVPWQHVCGTPQQRWDLIRTCCKCMKHVAEICVKGCRICMGKYQWKKSAAFVNTFFLVGLTLMQICVCVCVSGCEPVRCLWVSCLRVIYAEAARILSCHISVRALEEKISRPSGWFVV